jgi:hypothetical protein
MVHAETGDLNPPVAAPVPAAQLGPSEPSGSPARDVVGMVDGLHQTAEQIADGTWRSSFAELAEVVGTGATEAEARAHARAQALEIGHLVGRERLPRRR